MAESKKRGPARKYKDVTSICQFCQQPFTWYANPSHKERKFCSHTCFLDSIRNKFREFTCPQCREIFYRQVRPSHKPKFCSRSCRVESLRVKPKQFVCLNCSETFYRKTKPSRSPKYCSLACFHAWRRGINHPNWQGGHDHYYGPSWETKRLAALKRDGYTCQHCGITEEQLGVHHIISRKEFNGDWNLANRLDNLITLCTPCHARLHALEENHFTPVTTD